MRGHTTNELREIADILAPDMTARATGIRAAVTDLAGRRLEQAQLIASETSHMILMRNGDALTLDDSCYIACEGITYIVDYTIDPRIPRPRVWCEVYCHRQATNS